MDCSSQDGPNYTIGPFPNDAHFSFCAGVNPAPNSDEEPVSPVVAVLLHGFGSSRDEAGDLYKRLAAALAPLGIASLRLDFRGYGENVVDKGAKSHLTTVDTMVEDAREAVRYAREQAAHASGAQNRVVVVGFSLGALIASRVVLACEDLVEAFVGLSPVNNGLADVSAFLAGANSENVPLLETAVKSPHGEDGGANGAPLLDFDLGFRRLVLSPAFFSALAASPTTAASVAKFNGRVLLIAGTETWSHRNCREIVVGSRNSQDEDCSRDVANCREIVATADGHAAAEAVIDADGSTTREDVKNATGRGGNSRVQFVCLEGADHIFNCYSEEDSRVADVIAEICDFLVGLRRTEGEGF